VVCAVDEDGALRVVHPLVGDGEVVHGPVGGLGGGGIRALQGGHADGGRGDGADRGGAGGGPQ
jgi:hypothetical protein